MKFSLRDLLWLTLSVAMLIWLVISSSRIAELEKQLNSKTEALASAAASLESLSRQMSQTPKPVLPTNANSGSPFATNRDPFASNTGSTSTAEPQKNVRELSLEQQIKQLEQQLRNQKQVYQAELASLRQDNKRFSSSIRKINEVKKALADVRSHGVRLHVSLIAKLLSSERPEDQEIALNHILLANDESLASNIDYKPVNSVSMERVVHLFKVSEENAVKELALRAIQQLAPDRAISLGYQSGNLWRPQPKDPAENRIRQILDRKCDLAYQDCVLIEVVNDLREGYGIDVRTGIDVDEKTLVTFESKGRSLRNSLFDLVDQHNLTFVVDRESLKILTASDDNRLTTQVYKVSGLITDSRSSENLVEVCKERFGDDAKIELAKSDELVVTATEQIHYKVSKLFGAMNGG